LPPGSANSGLEKIQQRADQLLDEAKAAVEAAGLQSSETLFVDAAFTLERARISYLALQEIGTPEKQKVAADRLRTVQQLGKVNSVGRTAPSDRPSPAAVRPPVPDAAKQRDAEKVIRDLFKEEYAKKAPADRQALMRALLDNASRSGEDLPSLWVLLREAQDIAVQLGDVLAITPSCRCGTPRRSASGATSRPRRSTKSS
jgi:hypothetical protein